MCTSISELPSNIRTMVPPNNRQGYVDFLISMPESFLISGSLLDKECKLFPDLDLADGHFGQIVIYK